jgi:hypothetical protein
MLGKNVNKYLVSRRIGCVGGDGTYNIGQVIVACDNPGVKFVSPERLAFEAIKS